MAGCGCLGVVGVAVLLVAGFVIIGLVFEHKQTFLFDRVASIATPIETPFGTTSYVKPDYSDSRKAFDPRSGQGNVRIKNFRKAKRLLMKKVFYDHRRTMYCDCAFDKNKRIDLSGCSYKVRKRGDRARRVEFEHVVPASAFGHYFKEWTQGHPLCVRKHGKPYKGRSCAERVSSAFRLMESDLYNLYPAVGEVNADRLDYVMSELDGEVRAYGKCDVEIRDKKVEPSKNIRGDIARTYLYMDWAYPQFELITPLERAMFKRWSALDPVDAFERERARRIAKIQGNKNPFVR